MLQQDIQSQCRASPKMKSASVFKGYSRARKITFPALLFENEEYVFGNKDSSDSIRLNSRFFSTSCGRLKENLINIQPMGKSNRG
jgi:hypothetical protein